jgi:hypothetical protein
MGMRNTPLAVMIFESCHQSGAAKLREIKDARDVARQARGTET